MGHLVTGSLWGALQTRQGWEGEYGTSSTKRGRNDAGVKFDITSYIYSGRVYKLNECDGDGLMMEQAYGY